jgi:2-polyprenyl-3-methyl-5-hydroxy-6-metoxy-1,4-benzoquinol methylase
VKDYTVSNEIFHLVKCIQCGFLYTDRPPGQQEIGKYYQSSDYISHTDSKQGLFNQVYQVVRNISLQHKFNLLKSSTHHKKGNLLDYGCGTGAFLKFVQDQGWSAMGMEPDDGAREKASLLLGSPVSSPSQLKELPSNSFDAITLWHVLEHVHDLHETLEAFKRLLKQNGVLVIAVPNHSSWDATYYKQYWAAYDVPRHLYHFTPETIHRLLIDKGFSKVATKPMWFDAFYVSMLSEKYKSGRIRLLSACVIGWISNCIAFFQPGRCSSQIYVYELNAT